MYRIALLLHKSPGKSTHDRLNGILRYAKSVGNWDVQFISTANQEQSSGLSLHELINWIPHGIIVEGLIAEKKACDYLAKKGLNIPLVLSRSDATPVSTKLQQSYTNFSICCGESYISRAAADFLLQHQYASFGCIPIFHNEIPWAQNRSLFFEQALSASNPRAVCQHYKPHKSWIADSKSMAGWLKKLPKPCGIFVHNDTRARQVLTVCSMNGIKIPDEVAILGCDNDNLICESAIPRISSIEPDFEQAGYTAAWCLDKMLHGEKIKPILNDSPLARSLAKNLYMNEYGIPEIIYGVRRIVERASTIDTHGSGRIVAEAKNYIRLNAGRLIRSYEIANALNVSRRLLEMRFRETLHRTVNEVIIDAALDHAKELLQTSDIPTCQIPAHCGYKDLSNFRVAFKKRFGSSMRDWRKSHLQSAH